MIRNILLIAIAACVVANAEPPPDNQIWISFDQNKTMISVGQSVVFIEGWSIPDDYFSSFADTTNPRFFALKGQCVNWKSPVKSCMQAQIQIPSNGPLPDLNVFVRALRAIGVAPIQIIVRPKETKIPDSFFDDARKYLKDHPSSNLVDSSNKASK
jgi:hypothetical protein